MPRAPSVQAGQRFGRLVALKQIGRSRQGHHRWRCRCDCGRIHNVWATHLRQGSTKSCGCAMHPSGPAHVQFAGVGEIGGDFWNGLQRCADGRKGRRVLRFNLSKDFLWKLFLQQERRCAYTGQLLVLHPRVTRTASLDRIDSAKGYVRGNVHWVHKDVNMMKRTLTHERFLELCCFVARWHGKHRG